MPRKVARYPGYLGCFLNIYPHLVYAGRVFHSFEDDTKTRVAFVVKVTEYSPASLLNTV